MNAILSLIVFLAAFLGATAAIVSLWYCIDDFFAVLLNNPAIGEIPFFFPFVIWIIITILTGKVHSK